MLLVVMGRLLRSGCVHRINSFRCTASSHSFRRDMTPMRQFVRPTGGGAWSSHHLGGGLLLDDADSCCSSQLMMVVPRCLFAYVDHLAAFGRRIGGRRDVFKSTSSDSNTNLVVDDERFKLVFVVQIHMGRGHLVLCVDLCVLRLFPGTSCILRRVLVVVLLHNLHVDHLLVYDLCGFDAGQGLLLCLCH